MVGISRFLAYLLQIEKFVSDASKTLKNGHRKTYTNNFYTKNYNGFHELTGRHASGPIAAPSEILFQDPRWEIAQNPIRKY